MKNYWIIAVGLWITTSLAWGVETSERLSQPFYLPQTTFFLGNTQYKFTTKNLGSENISHFNGSGVNTYGFAIEVNSTRYLNIGGYFRALSQGGGVGGEVNTLFSTVLGGFLRFFYAPEFLQSNRFHMNCFVRPELGGGPVVFGDHGGLMGQGGIHLGFETYFSKWVGLTWSVGKLYEIGKDTIDANKTKTSFTSDGTVWMLALKTTFL